MKCVTVDTWHYPGIRPAAHPLVVTQEENPMNTTSPPFSLKKAVITACIGNFGEWFDFALFGFFAVTLSHVFFPATNDLGALLATFATFSVASSFGRWARRSAGGSATDTVESTSSRSS